MINRIYKHLNVVDLFLNFGGHRPFSSLIPLFWTSGDVSSEFQRQSGQPSLIRSDCRPDHIESDPTLDIVWVSG